MRNVGRGYKISNFFFYLKWRKFAYIRCCETLASCFDPFFFLVIFFQVRRSSSQARKCVCPSSQLKQKKERFFFGRRRRGNCPISPPTNFKNPFSLSLWLLLQWTTAIGLWRVSGGPFSSSSSFSPFLSLRRFFSSLSLGRLHQGGGGSEGETSSNFQNTTCIPPPSKKKSFPFLFETAGFLLQRGGGTIKFSGHLCSGKDVIFKSFWVCLLWDRLYIYYSAMQRKFSCTREREKKTPSVSNRRNEIWLTASHFPFPSIFFCRRAAAES